MIEGNPIIKPTLSVAARVIGDQAYILDPSVGQLERLNAVGTYIWTLIEQGERRFDEVHQAVVEAFEINEEMARGDLHSFVEALRAKRLIDLID